MNIANVNLKILTIQKATKLSLFFVVPLMDSYRWHIFNQRSHLFLVIDIFKMTTFKVSETKMPILSCSKTCFPTVVQCMTSIS